jgi:hypothetical protein
MKRRTFMIHLDFSFKPGGRVRVNAWNDWLNNQPDLAFTIEPALQEWPPHVDIAMDETVTIRSGNQFAVIGLCNRWPTVLQGGLKDLQLHRHSFPIEILEKE